jgi:hypothetical protein
LALTPIDKINIAWANIKNQKIDGINLQPIIAYFESTWLNGVEQFKPSVWNHFDFIGPKTNNDLEAFNRVLNLYLTSPNPNIYTFINHLKRIDQEMSQLANDYRDNPLKMKSKSKAQKEKERIFVNLKNSYLENRLPLLDYLYACASNIEWINYCDSDSDPEDLLGADSISEISDEDEDNIDDFEADVENDVEMYDTEPETYFEAATIETENGFTYQTLIPATRYVPTRNDIDEVHKEVAEMISNGHALSMS